MEFLVFNYVGGLFSRAFNPGFVQRVAGDIQHVLDFPDIGNFQIHANNAMHRAYEVIGMPDGTINLMNLCVG